MRVALLVLAGFCKPAFGRRLGEPVDAAAADAAAELVVDASLASLQLSSECTEACPGQTTLEGCFGVHKRKCQAELASKFELSNSNSAEDNRQILQSFQASSASVSPEAAALAEATPAATHIPSVRELLKSNTASDFSYSSAAPPTTGEEGRKDRTDKTADTGGTDDADDEDDPFSHSIEVGTIPNGMVGEESKLESTPNVVAKEDMPPKIDVSYGSHVRSVLEKARRQTSQVRA